MENDIIKSTIREFKQRVKYLENLYKTNLNSISKKEEMVSEMKQLNKMIECLTKII